MVDKGLSERIGDDHASNADLTLKEEIRRHIRFTMGRDPAKPNRHACFMGLAHSVRDRLIDRWIRTQRSQYDTLAKRVYFLSLEFLPGRFLMNYLISLKMVDEVRRTVRRWALILTNWKRKNGMRVWETAVWGAWPPATWILWPAWTFPATATASATTTASSTRPSKMAGSVNSATTGPARVPLGNPPGRIFDPVRFYGRTETYTDAAGRQCHRWVDGETVMAMACDILVPGYGDDFVTNMRLWRARSSREFNLDEFNQGDYIGAVEAKVLSENISGVLYPSDEMEQGRELR
jgi:starch phosphorylase